MYQSLNRLSYTIMEKDKSIIELIEKLKKVVDFTSLDIVDYWEADLCAIGLKKANRLVYISNYNYINNNIINYDFDMEIIDGSNLKNLDIIRFGRNVSEEKLIEQIKAFFNVL